MKSQDEKRLEGTERNDRKKGADKAASMRLIKKPTLPPFLRVVANDRQKKIFAYAGRLLVEVGVVTKLDVISVFGYAVALDNWIIAVENLNKKKQVQTYAKGGNNISGYWTAYEKANKILTDAEKKIGFNIYIRERMSSFMEGEAGEEQSPFEKLFSEMSAN